MSEEGFTLTDGVAALLIVGLALTGLGRALQAGERLQSATTRTVAENRDARQIAATLGGALSATAPGGRIEGQGGYLIAACGPRPCRFALSRTRDGYDLHTGGDKIALPGRVRSARFLYLSDGDRHDHWPDGTGRLAAIELEADGRVLAHADLRLEQPLDCSFDPVARRCITPR